MKSEVNWDILVSNMKFSELRNLSPEMMGRRCPSLYSPDMQYYYMSSLDIDVEAINEEELEIHLLEIKTLLNRNTSDKSKTMLLRIDFIEICRMLGKLSAEPETYSDPDRLLME